MPLLTTPKRSPFVRNHLIRDAISKAIYDEMALECWPQRIHIFGEGAQVKVHYDAPDIERDFPDRVHTLPISEDGNVNFCVGASLLGVKPVVDIITADFLYRAMDSICNTAAKLNFVRPDQPPATIVIRAEFLTGGPTTGQRPEALFTHIPGLNVVIPSTPRDAYGLMLTALRTPGVTLFFEDRMIEDSGPWMEEDLRTGPSVELGKSFTRMMGQRGLGTIVTYGVMRQRVERLLREYKWDGDFYAEENLRYDLVDLRSIYPLDFDYLRFMLQRTGRLLIIEPDVQYGGVGAEIAATLVEEMPFLRVKRLGGKRATIPAAMNLQSETMPSDMEIVDAINHL